MTRLPRLTRGGQAIGFIRGGIELIAESLAAVGRRQVVLAFAGEHDKALLGCEDQTLILDRPTRERSIGTVDATDGTTAAECPSGWGPS
jgi:hypothetical protein